MIKILVEILPAFLPIIIYFLWLLVRMSARKIIVKNLEKSGKIINATYQEVKNDQKTDQIISDFSLQNKNFIIVLYLSFFIAIICFLFFALRVPKIENGKYIPAHIENSKIIPSRIVE